MPQKSYISEYGRLATSLLIWQADNKDLQAVNQDSLLTQY